MIGLVATAVAFGTVRGTRTSDARLHCPENVLLTTSATAPVAAVVRAAQRQLAKRTIDSQGTRYQLTPRNAPIVFIAQIGASRSQEDRRTPGLLALHQRAASACGEQTAQASWAVHYDIPVATIAGLGGFTFFVATRAGWRFWGNWCGVGNSPRWREANCP